MTKWKPDAKVEEVYSEANFAKNQIKDRKDISYQFYSHEDTIRMLEDKAMEDEFKHSLEITVLRCGISRNMIRKQSGW